MSILFDHNQKAYEAAASMLEQTGRAAIIHPTGTGKSFIAFQLCADHAECSICWLSPSEYIFTTQLEKWRAAGGGEIGNIKFITYARLMRMSGDDMGEIQPDYIILDEFHRCGAAQWGGGVERLREMYQEAKVLGLSATNIRYLDNQRDMAWELFGGNIASELTLGAAIAQGILPAPKYVLSVYSYQRELKRFGQKVRQARNKAVRDAAERELEALRRALEKADGLAEVFARHMASGNRQETMGEDVDGSEKRLDVGVGTADGAKGAGHKKTTGHAGIAGQKKSQTEIRESNIFMGNGKLGEDCRNVTVPPKLGRASVPNGQNHGRYIVFCANYGHLLEMRELAPEWFREVDPAPHIYTAYSDDPETSSEFAAFKADTSGHLKLLYCIDMLNEGIHVDGLSGVILLRPTVSPTIYKQQIGRALAAGGENTPIIFDIVMNIENLCSIGGIEEELRSAVLFCRANGRGDAIVQEHFRIVDELGDCRRLFAQLNETLGASWNAMYAMAAEYYERHGNLEIPAKYTTADGYSLGAWVATQRKVYAGKVAGNLSGEQIRRLTAIGMCWQGTQEAAWERNFAEAEKYFVEHGDLAVPADYVTEGGCKLGRWLRRQKERYQGLAAEMGKDGNAGWGIFDTEKDGGNADWNAVREAGADSKKESGLCGAGCDPQENAAGQVKFHRRRVERLAQIGMVWDNTDPWERKFLLAKRYYEENGNLKMPADYVVDGVWLDRWLREQKARWKVEENDRDDSDAGEMPCKAVEQLQGSVCKAQESRKPLTSEQKEKLSSIGFLPGVSQAELSWREQYGQAEEFYQKHGNLTIPKRYTADNGKDLGIWLQHQRANRRNGRLAGWQVHLLDGIGMVWEVPDAWETGFAHAQEYARQTGNLKVPNAYVCADGYRLGKWISNQRCAYAGIMKTRLTPEKICQLEEIGMVWNVGQGRRTRICRIGEKK